VQVDLEVKERYLAEDACGVVLDFVVHGKDFFFVGKFLHQRVKRGLLKEGARYLSD